MEAVTHERETEQVAGRLEGIDLTELIRALSDERRTGVLSVYRYPVRKRLYFLDGRIVFACSSEPNDRLGESLLRQGKVSLRQLELALGQLGTGKRIGRLLVEAGVLGEEELAAAVLEQLRSIFLDLLTWEEGSYHFSEGDLPTKESITLDLPSRELLLQGIRSIHAFDRIRRCVGSPRTVFAMHPDWRASADELSMSEGERLVVERLVQGEATIESLCGEICLSSFEIHRTLWAFKLLGLVESREQSLSAEHSEELEGRLSDSSFAQILVRLGREGETGVLYVRRGKQERSFHFGGGRCVFATSNEQDDGLVSYLFRRGVISLNDREETVRRLLSNKRVGTILREMGVIDDRDLREMVRLQVGEVVFDTFRWVEGEYVFVPGPLPSAEKITLDESIGAIVAEGVRRIASWTRVIQGCGGLDNPLCLTPNYEDILDTIDAAVAEWSVVTALKSPQTPRRVCQQTELNDFRVCQILWTLKLLGAIQDSPVELDATPDEVLDTESLEDEVAGPFAQLADEHAGETDETSESTDLPDEDAEPFEPEESMDSEAAAEPVASETETETETETEPEAELEVAPEPEWRGPDDLDELIQRFNAMHRVIYRAVRSEIGAGAANFVRSCCQSLSDDGNPVEGVAMHSDGSWDAEGLRKRVCAMRSEEPWSAYQQVLDAEFSAVEPHLGPTRADELKQKIWEIEQGG